MTKLDNTLLDTFSSLRQYSISSVAVHWI